MKIVIPEGVYVPPCCRDSIRDHELLPCEQHEQWRKFKYGH